jgi:hypothetical protein
MEFSCGLEVSMDETAVITDPEVLFLVLKPSLPRSAQRRPRDGIAVALAAFGALEPRSAGGVPGDGACARGDVGATQQDRQGECARD